MKERRDIFDNVKGPRDALKVITILIGLGWFAIPTAFGLLVYAIIVGVLKMHWKAVVSVCGIVAIVAFFREWWLVDFNVSAVFYWWFWLQYRILENGFTRICSRWFWFVV